MSHDGDGDGGDFAALSRSRQRFNTAVGPEPFLEALAIRIAVDTALSFGRLAVAPALFSIFQVCRTWRSISHSNPLWQTLRRRIWHRSHLLHYSWYDEYIYRHRTARNFHSRRYDYNTLNDPPNNNNNEPLSCCRFALSEYHLASGFSDGSVRLYHLPTRLHFTTYHPINVIILASTHVLFPGCFFIHSRLVFASHDGDIHVASINVPGATRRAHLGDVFTDGILVDFTCCDRWWVGLYAGVPNRAFHVRNSNTEEIVFIGGTLMDPHSVDGWHLLTDLSDHIGRIRITRDELAVRFARRRVIVFDLRNQMILADEEFRRDINVGASDAYDRALMLVNRRGVANVWHVSSLAEICQFMACSSLLGCVNGGHCFMSVGDGIRVWELHHGEHLYVLREQIGDASAMIADERYVAACSADNTIHFWDFGAHI